MVGYQVWLTHRLGGGFPDLVVGHPKTNILMEVKTEGGKLNDLEQLFFDTWTGPCFVVHNTEEALEAIRKTIRR